MKNNCKAIIISVLLTAFAWTGAHAVQTASVSDREYFVIAAYAGLIEGYVPGARVAVDTFYFSDTVFGLGLLTIDGMDEAVGAYELDDNGLTEHIEAACIGVSEDGEVGLGYDIEAWSLTDLFITGTIRLEGSKDWDDAGSATGVFFGVVKPGS